MSDWGVCVCVKCYLVQPRPSFLMAGNSFVFGQKCVYLLECQLLLPFLQ